MGYKPNPCLLGHFMFGNHIIATGLAEGVLINEKNDMDNNNKQFFRNFGPHLTVEST